MEIVRISALFAITAVAEIVGCYLPWLVLKQNQSAWLLIPAAVSLALFAWLLTLHPSAAGRIYAAYGGSPRDMEVRLRANGIEELALELRPAVPEEVAA